MKRSCETAFAGLIIIERKSYPSRATSIGGGAHEMAYLAGAMRTASKEEITAGNEKNILLDEKEGVEGHDVPAA